MIQFLCGMMLGCTIGVIVMAALQINKKPSQPGGATPKKEE